MDDKKAKNDALAEAVITLTVRKVGNSTGLILPKELLARLNLKEGDKLHIVEHAEGGFKLSPHCP